MGILVYLAVFWEYPSKLNFELHNLKVKMATKKRLAKTLGREKYLTVNFELLFYMKAQGKNDIIALALPGRSWVPRLTSSTFQC